MNLIFGVSLHAKNKINLICLCCESDGKSREISSSTRLAKSLSKMKHKELFSLPFFSFESFSPGLFFPRTDKENMKRIGLSSVSDFVKTTTNLLRWHHEVDYSRFPPHIPEYFIPFTRACSS